MQLQEQSHCAERKARESLKTCWQRFALAEIRAPELRWRVTCRTSPDGPSTEHDVVLGRDWHLETGHDLDAERVGLAFGAYHSCAQLADHVMPAARDLVHHRARLARPAFASDGQGGWIVRDAATSCIGDSWQTTATCVASHTRSARHAAVRHSVDPASLTEVVDRICAAMPTLGVLTDQARTESVPFVTDGPEGVFILWEAGVHPRLISRIHGFLFPEGGPPLTVEAYKHVLTSSVGVDAFARYVRAVRTGDAGAPDLSREICRISTMPPEEDGNRPRTKNGLPDAPTVKPASPYSLAEFSWFADIADLTVAQALAIFETWHRAGYRPNTKAIPELLDAAFSWRQGGRFDPVAFALAFAFNDRTMHHPDRSPTINRRELDRVAGQSLVPTPPPPPPSGE